MRRSFTLLLPLLTASIVACSTTPADDADRSESAVSSADRWEVQRSSPMGLSAVVHAKGLSIAVGTGEVWTSADDKSWAAHHAGTPEQLHAIAASDSRIVAVGSSGAVSTSTDGLRWVASRTPTNDYLKAVIFTGTKFLALGIPSDGTNSRRTFASTDGVTWSVQEVGSLRGEAFRPNTIATNGRRLVGLGYNSMGYSDDDGRTWQPASNQLAASMDLYPVPGFLKVIWDGSEFVTRHSALYFTSRDGESWTLRSPGKQPNYDDQAVFVSTGSTLYAGVFAATSRPDISTDHGTTWTAQRETPAMRYAPTMRDMAFTGEHLVGVGNRDIITSADASAWESSVTGFAAGDINHVAFSGQRLLARRNISSCTNNLVSSDGVAWSLDGDPNCGRPTFKNGPIVWDGSRFVSTEEGVSSDGIHWTPPTTRLPTTAVEVAAAGSGYVALIPRARGYDGRGGHPPQVFLSADGLAWDTTPHPLTLGVATGIAAGRGVVVAISGEPPLQPDGSPHGGAIVLSVDGGVTFRPAATQPAGAAGLYDVRWAGDHFVTVGANGTFMTSTDGDTWTSIDVGTHTTLRAVSASARGVVVAGNRGVIFTSADGTHFSDVSAPTGRNLTRAIDAWGSFYVFGDADFVARLR